MNMSIVENIEDSYTKSPLESVAGTDRRRIILALPGDNYSSAYNVFIGEYEYITG